MIFEHMPEKKELQPIILFDSWFSWRDFLQRLDEKWYNFITMGKTDRNVFIDKHIKVKVSDLFKQTNIPNLTQKEYLDKYSNRWSIEVWFKDFKQLFWWKDNSFRWWLATVRMLYITFFAYTIAMKEKIKSWISKITIWSVCESLRKESLIELLKKFYAFWTKQIALQSALSRYGF